MKQTTTTQTPTPEPLGDHEIALAQEVASTDATPRAILERAPREILKIQLRVHELDKTAEAAQDRAARRRLELQSEVANNPELTNDIKRKAALEERLATDAVYAKWTVFHRDNKESAAWHRIRLDYWINLQRNARVLLLAGAPDAKEGEAQ